MQGLLLGEFGMCVGDSRGRGLFTPGLATGRLPCLLAGCGGLCSLPNADPCSLPCYLLRRCTEKQQALVLSRSTASPYLDISPETTMSMRGVGMASQASGSLPDRPMTDGAAAAPSRPMSTTSNKQVRACLRGASPQSATGAE